VARDGNLKELRFSNYIKTTLDPFRITSIQSTIKDEISGFPRRGFGCLLLRGGITDYCHFMQFINLIFPADH
jgi:hypothetical protein